MLLFTILSTLHKSVFSSFFMGNWKINTLCKIYYIYDDYFSEFLFDDNFMIFNPQSPAL